MAQRKPQFKTLGRSKAKFQGLETFERPANCVNVKCVTSEVTAHCPVTGQPDFYTVSIEYMPDQLCVESKALKLYVQAFRDKGMFCEQFADKIADDFFAAVKPNVVEVTVIQVPRGGIAIHATSVRQKTT